jgi:hypothetical protein
MPEILKYPLELQPQINALIPYLIENLGNPKVSDHYSSFFSFEN